MGLHISSHSRFRFDFPTLRGIDTDATAADKTGWVGPFTRAQLVELIWRVKEVRLTASGNYSFSGGEGEITGTISLDVTMIRQNAMLDGAASELDVFGNNMASQNPAYGAVGTYDLMQWRGIAPNMEAVMYLVRGDNWLRKDAAGYWLDTSYGARSPFFLSATAEKEVAWGEGAVSTMTLDVYASQFEQGTITTTLNLSNGGVTIPLQTKVPFEGSLVGATSASLEITKWFPYATTA